MCCCFTRGKWSPQTCRIYTDNENQRRIGVFQSVTELGSSFQVDIKTKEEKTLIKRAIEKNDFISKVISGNLLKATISVMYKRNISAGETIIREGNKGLEMYVSYKGTYEVTKSKFKSSFNDVRVFGELAIIYNVKRQATIKAVTDCQVWVLDSTTYQQLLLRSNIKEQDEKANFLLKNDVLKDAGEQVLKLAANSLSSQFFTGGKNIVVEGEKGNKFYIVRAGTVTVKKEKEGIIGTHGRGYCFGERALLEETRRQATITANPPFVECLTLSRKRFFELTEYLKIKPSKPSTTVQPNPYEHLKLSDLQKVTTIGLGGFGRIELVRLREDKKQVFALKMMNKHSIVEDNRQQQALNERMQMNFKSQFIIRMYKTFKDTRYVYYLMEYCPGGDLWHLLYRRQAERRFKEKDAKFIVGCILEALEYLHNRDIIYRDLKPENVLLTPTGYFKLTDFGYIKKLTKFEKTFTFAGTVEYVAPEVAQKKTYDRTVDFWACGIFIFELLCGRTPFSTFDGNENKIFKNILNGIDKIQFPSVVSPLAKDLIKALCRPDPVERLGISAGVLELKSQKWFSGFNWQKLQKLQMESPFKAQSRSYTGRQYPPEKNIPPEEISGWDKEFEYFGYS